MPFRLESLLLAASLPVLAVAASAAASDCACEERAAACASKWAERMQPSAFLTPHSYATHAAFWGRGNHLKYLLHMLSRHFEHYATFVDVGAAVYNTDDTYVGAVSFMKHWGKASHPVTVHAFEPSDSKIDDWPTGANQLRVHRNLISDREGPITMYGSGATATTNVRLLDFRRWANAKLIRQLNATTLDALAHRENIEHIDIMKIDCEGVEWEALLGAYRLLASQKVSVIMLEYGLSWSASIYWNGGNNNRRNSVTGTDYTAKSVRTMQTPSLYSVSRYLGQMGYDAYLVGSALTGKQCRSVRELECESLLQFIPLRGGCWHDDFELGFNPRDRGYGFTWHDVIAVRRDSAENELLLSHACSAASDAALATSQEITVKQKAEEAKLAEAKAALKKFKKKKVD